MNSVTGFSRLPQLRMIPVPGTSLFRYERRLSNRWVACNHSRARAIVGIYSRKAKQLCANLIGDLKTTGESPSELSGGSQKPGESFTSGKVMSMNVPAPLNSFSASSQR